VPTHNQNHHKYNNKPGDSGRSPILFRRNHLLALLVYPTVTGINQQADIKRFFRELWQKRPQRLLARHQRVLCILRLHGSGASGGGTWRGQ
jgi:hypothetical protein